MRIKGLIDTGAECTLVEESSLQPLEIKPSGYADIHTPTTIGGPVKAPQYDVDLRLGSSSPSSDAPSSTRTFATVPVVGASLQNQAVQALIGRDILKDCLVVYDGQARTFVVAI